ncbi:MAG TPA: 50S ribosomal protein L32 [Firmicutes bacterium]|jgi:large subunit ribosomal protein L32|nr:50S ribosomal protein L32 [Bacillota bacterium]
MANPKNRTSRTRKRLRRSNYKTTAPTVGACPQCHEPKLAHIVCGNCGFYNGREIIAKANNA